MSAWRLKEFEPNSKDYRDWLYSFAFANLQVLQQNYSITQVLDVSLNWNIIDWWSNIQAIVYRLPAVRDVHLKYLHDILEETYLYCTANLGGWPPENSKPCYPPGSLYYIHPAPANYTTQLFNP